MKKDENRRDPSTQAKPGEGAALAAVSSLMDDRRRFEGWISSLEARREATAQHVFERVHADYTTRLRAVVDQLASHADGLRSELNALCQRLDTLREDQKRAQDERAEGELRAHVGELSSADWEKMAAKSDARLTDIGVRHGALEQELNRTRELLEAAENPGRAPEASRPEAKPPAPRPNDVAPPAPAAEEREKSTVGRPSGSVQMAPSEQQSLGIEEAAPTSAAPAPVAEVAPPTEPTPRQSKFDELAFLSSVVDTPAGVKEEPAPSDEPDETTRRQSFAMRAQDDEIVNLSEARSTPLDNLVTEHERKDPAALAGKESSTTARTSTGADGAKTLKCSECASMNYPTEWYCERCGAELASL